MKDISIVGNKPRIVTGYKTVSGAAAAIVSFGPALTWGVLLLSAPANVTNFVVSTNPGVSLDSPENGGFLLVPGASVFIPAEFLKDVYLLLVTGTPIVHYMAY